jgi:UDP-N-acetylglucosamine 2-epimerase (hydrolysing)
MFHPVPRKGMKVYVGNLIESLLNDTHNYVVIYPNNDFGSQYIIDAIAR